MEFFATTTIPASAADLQHRLTISELPRWSASIDGIGHLLLDLGLNELAVEHLERGLALGRDTGILFWRATIDAHLAVARPRLWHKDIAAALQATLEQTRLRSERYLTVRCLDGLA